MYWKYSVPKDKLEKMYDAIAEVLKTSAILGNYPLV